MATVIRADGLTRRYGDVDALADVSLEVGAGELVGLLGPNGAGKTTMIELLAGVRLPTSGSAAVCGGNPRSPATRQAIGVVPQSTALPESWRVRELIDFVRAHYPEPVPTDDLVEKFDIQQLAQRQIGGLSGGQQRRTAVAIAFAAIPGSSFWTNRRPGSMSRARRGLWQCIRSFHTDGGTIVLTSHYLEEVQALADRIVVLDRGRVLEDGPLADIVAKVRLKRVTLVEAVLPRLPDDTTVEWSDERRTRLLTHDPVGLVRVLVESGASFADIDIESATLEDAFLSLTRPEPGGVTGAEELRR